MDIFIQQSSLVFAFKKNCCGYGKNMWTVHCVVTSPDLNIDRLTAGYEFVELP